MLVVNSTRFLEHARHLSPWWELVSAGRASLGCGARPVPSIGHLLRTLKMAVNPDSTNHKGIIDDGASERGRGGSDGPSDRYRG
jgi:hypothetical protein